VTVPKARRSTPHPHPLIAALEAERVRQGMPQHLLATLMGTSQSAVSEILTGVTPNVTLETLKKLVDALGVTLHWEIVPTRPTALQQDGRLRRKSVVTKP
jgi:transcriptional regulator with XRE-family HTH domain